MASYRLPKLARYIPLWQRKVPPYPLHTKGGPQLRLLLPLFWMKMIKSQKKLPPHQVVFEVHPQMTTNDVKNYLEKIYKVPVLSVRTTLFAGEKVEHAKGFILRREDDRRVAYVELDGQTFDFPDIFPEGKKTEMEKTAAEYKKLVKTTEKEQQKNWDKKDLPVWFR